MGNEKFSEFPKNVKIRRKSEKSVKKQSGEIPCMPINVGD